MNLQITAKGASGEHAAVVVTTTMTNSQTPTPVNQIVSDVGMVSGDSTNVDVVPGQYLTITVYLNPVVTP